MSPDHRSKIRYDWFFEQLGEAADEATPETEVGAETEPHLESDQVARLAQDSLEEPTEE